MVDSPITLIIVALSRLMLDPISPAPAAVSS